MNGIEHATGGHAVPWPTRLRRTLAAVVLAASATIGAVAPAAAAAPAFPNVVVPAPGGAVASGVTFTLTPAATVSSDVAGIGGYLAGIMRSSTGYPLPAATGGAGTIQLLLSGAPAAAGPQGYQLTITSGGVVVEANQPAGLFAGVQTLLQLLPPAIDSPTVVPGPWTAPGGTILDYPRFAYAASRYITVVPEIDMPGHTNAALASYAALNCNGVAPRLYTGTKVGFSSLCVPLDLTYTFIDQVVGELAALTPGPYLHIGGDEASSTTAADYASFVDRAQQIVAAHGKTVIGWHDIAKATPLPSTVAEFWDTTTTNAPLAAAVATGTTVIMSPANHAYLDMKYNKRTKLGQTWAGLVDVNTAYGWNPGAYVSGVGEASVRGVEAPLWTETIVTSADIDYMAFPRLPAIAELGWSPWSIHEVTAFDARLGAQGPRWRIEGINYYQSAQIAWPAGS